MLFGENGAILNKLPEAQLEKQMKDQVRQHAWWPAILFALATFGLVVAFTKDHQLQMENSTLLFIGLALVFIVVASLANFTVRAVEKGDLPINWHMQPAHKHVSGLVATIAIVVILGLIWGARQLEENFGEIEITDRIGIGVVLVMATIFGVMILLPKLAASGPVKAVGNYLRPTNWEGTPFAAIGGFFSTVFSKVDSWLVYIVAPSAGVTQKLWYERYIVSCLYLVPCALLAWVLPAPYGLIPIAWAFIVCVAIARRWSWIEGDRETILRRPNFDPSSLRVGVSQDLRDEALLALLFLIFLLPFGMRQAHLGASVPAFTMDASVVNSPLAWLSFFGVELAKAVPFVDWFDIYGARSTSTIQSETAAASHIVFAMRATVDLVFLSALVQAISISVRMIQHKKSFFNREIDRLDPMVEAHEFSAMAKRDANNEWKFAPRIARYHHYDHQRLAYLRVNHRKNSPIYAVAKYLRDQSHEQLSYAEIFLEAAAQEAPNLRQVNSAFDKARDNKDLPIEYLIAARSYLNGRPEFNELRGRLIALILGAPESHERIIACRNILVGAQKDSVLQNRERVIDVIYKSSWFDRLSLRALRRAASSDPSAKNIRVQVRNALRQIEKGQIPKELVSAYSPKSR